MSLLIAKRRRKSNTKSRLLEGLYFLNNAGATFLSSIEQLSQKESVLFNGLIFLVTDQRNSQPTGKQ